MFISRWLQNLLSRLIFIKINHHRSKILYGVYNHHYYHHRCHRHCRRHHKKQTKHETFLWWTYYLNLHLGDPIRFELPERWYCLHFLDQNVSMCFRLGFLSSAILRGERMSGIASFKLFHPLCGVYVILRGELAVPCGEPRILHES